jgi:hypothetical protein
MEADEPAWIFDKDRRHQELSAPRVASHTDM